MTIDTVPVNLYQAHARLQSDLVGLWQECASGWLTAASRLGTDGSAKMAQQVEALLQPGNGETFATRSSAAFWHAVEHQLGVSSAFTKQAMQSQLGFTKGAHEALVRWQRAVVDAFQSDSEPRSSVSLLEQWMQLWTAAAASRAAGK